MDEENVMAKVAAALDTHMKVFNDYVHNDLLDI
jgi:hypothetical protein